MKKLAELHNKVRELKVYYLQQAKLLYYYSLAFIPLLDQLTAFNEVAFEHIAASFNEKTKGYVRKAYEATAETDRNDAFYDGVIHLNNNINDAIESLNEL
ncbi:MAG: hypothetical protein ACOH2A_02965 [Sphingobacteriaceae bacterium]